jgi:hypothetical protein
VPRHFTQPRIETKMYSDKRNFRKLLGMSTLERLQDADQHKAFLGCAAERSGILSHLA